MALSVDEQIYKRIGKQATAKSLTVFTVSKEAAMARVMPTLDIKNIHPEFINDSCELTIATKRMVRHLRFERPLSAFKDAIQAVCLPVTISYQDFSLSLGEAAVNRKGSALDTEGKKVFYVREDAIEAKNLIHYLSFFSDIPPSKRPAVILETATANSRLAKDMANATTNLRIEPLYERDGAWRERPQIDSCENFASMFYSGAYGACTSYNGGQHVGEHLRRGHGLEALPEMAVELLRIKAYDYEGDKFQALPDAQKLLANLNRAKELSRSDDELNKLLSLKAYLGLWIAYIDESYVGGIENSAAIATHLKDETLFAHSLRLSHLVSGFSDVTESFVSRAVDIFQRNGNEAFYIHARNNLLLNRLHIAEAPCEEFANLAEYALVTTPYLDRMANVFNNAGTSFLIAGRLDEAELYYERAARFSGQAIHYIGIELNRLVARYLDGQQISNAEVLKLHRKIKRANLPKQYAYHQSYMHWNLVVLSDFNHEVQHEVFSYLAEKRFMDYGDVVSGKLSMIEFLSKNMKSAKARGRFPGARGKFIHEKQIVPIIHYSWM